VLGSKASIAKLMPASPALLYIPSRLYARVVVGAISTTIPIGEDLDGGVARLSILHAVGHLVFRIDDVGIWVLRVCFACIVSAQVRTTAKMPTSSEDLLGQNMIFAIAIIVPRRRKGNITEIAELNVLHALRYLVFHLDAGA